MKFMHGERELWVCEVRSCLHDKSSQGDMAMAVLEPY